MTSNKPDETFKSLAFPRKDMPQEYSRRYRVYTDSQNYQLVEAESALEALKASGLAKAHRIARDALYFHNVLEVEQIMAPAEGEAAAAGAPAAAETKPPAAEPAAVAAPPPAAASEDPLSHDDVDKLLKNGEEATGT